MNTRAAPSIRCKLFSWLPSVESLIRGCAALIFGTVVAFILSFLLPLVRPDEDLLRTYTKQALPVHTIAMGILIAITLVIISVCSIGKLWRSLRLGLVQFSLAIWTVCIFRRLPVGKIPGFCPPQGGSSQKRPFCHALRQVLAEHFIIRAILCRERPCARGGNL